MLYNLSYKLIGIETDLEKIYYFPLAPYLLDSLIEGEPEHLFLFNVDNKLEKPVGLNIKFDYCWGGYGEKLIYFEHPLLPGLKAKLLLDLSGKHPKMTVNNNYYRLAKYKFENVWPPGQHLTNLIILKLLQNNILTLHCASFSNKRTNEGCLLMGASNTGKSLTTFKAMSKGYQYHSEDLTFIRGNKIFTSPLMSIQSDKLPNKSILLKYNIFIRRLIGLNILLPKFSVKEDFYKFINKHDLKSVSEIKHIFILERGNRSVRKLNKSDALRKMLILNILELSYYRDHILRSLSYFNKDFDLENLRTNEVDIYRSIVEKSDCYLLSTDSPNEYFNLIEDVIK